MTTQERLIGWQHAFDEPVVLAVTVAVVAVLALTPLLVWLLSKAGKVDETHRRELMLRYYSWLVITPLLLVPILLGALWTILGVGILSLFCYREYARATGLFREKLISLVVTLAIVAVTFTVLDHWQGLFAALTPYTVALIASVAILKDQPEGYIQRVALGIFAFALFGTGLGHLGFLANDAGYRGYIVLLLLSVELNDVFAYISGKTMGRSKLAPQTSPNKTKGGALGAVVLTTALVVCVGHFVFAGTALQHPAHLIVLGILLSVAGQLGDLMLSSIKRDLGVKDLGVTIPGHGGLLDRFDSLLLAAPVFFHYINYFVGVGVEQTPRILTGSL